MGDRQTPGGKPDRTRPATPARGGGQDAKPAGLKVLAFRALGVAALGLATAGIFLPLLPTTVFLLVAVWAFAKGSPEWAERVRRHPRFGPYLTDWETRRAIPRRAKVLAVAMMTGSVGILWLSSRNLVLTAGVGALLACVAAWIVTRPS